MIFVTTGTQLPFDRLVAAIISVAGRFPDKKFRVQALFTRSPPIPENVIILKSLSPLEFTDYLEKAELVISHAGVGSIVSAAQMQKVLILFPRLGRLKEHRNDHQVATCDRLKTIYPLHVAINTDELLSLLNTFYLNGLTPMKEIGEYASTELIDSIKEFINGELQILPVST
jgi:UDP-N-acetylglucosamine transferase subunit ALG13